MYNIIKLLLLGVDQNVNIAGLLFGLTKDKKVGSDTVSNIIYRNLNYSLQIKLKKTSINIKNELEKIKSLSTDEIDLKKQIAICKNMPMYVKKATIEKIDEMKSSNNEYYKQLLYVKTLLNFPWPSNEDDQFFLDIGKDNKKSIKFLDNMIKCLDKKVYGHIITKSMIKELIGKWFKNPTSSGGAIGLVGPPGVGKTLIAKAIGEALNIPFVQITLGGQNDGEILHGHGYTYSGAQPGMVVKKMVEAGNSRCIMYFDELDKATKKHDTNEIFNILIHMTDPNINCEFQDRFFQEINFPLNKVIFIFSYNDSDAIDPILIDRITEINTKPYSIIDKINISKNFILGEMATMVGFNKDNITISDDNLKFIIEEYTNEAGVREIKRKIERIFLKMNIDRIYNTGLFYNKVDEKIILNKEEIIKYLDKPNMSIQLIHNKNMVGIVNGLYATDSGLGGIIPIQIYKNYIGSEGKPVLKITGRQGTVMKESVVIAYNHAMDVIIESKQKEFFESFTFGIHIHTPDGAVPKEGPSAGCAFATAFVSRILNLKIKNDIGMTGEIDRAGNIKKIGGLPYKLNGAKKAGIRLVLVSEENKEDVDEIKNDDPDLINDDFEVKLVSKLTDAIKLSLIDLDESLIVCNK